MTTSILLLLSFLLLTYHGIREGNKGQDRNKNIAFILAVVAFIAAIIFLI